MAHVWQSNLWLVVIITGGLLSWSEPMLGRPVPDETLGNERSRVIDRSARDFDIDGGARRDRNLFHSFREFNVDEGGSVYFLNPDGVENIFNRVTGANRSDILGTLGVRGSANLFLMNPNGILFGQNARLDVQGSFVGMTASALQFGEQGFFSATNPESPSQLLTVNPSAFLFNQIPASIQNQSRASAGQYPSNSFNVFGIRVPDGRSLLLLGGDININGGGLVALGGRIELGGVTGTGTVGLNSDTNSFRLIFPENVPRANVSLTNSAGVLVAASGGGDIAIHANNINVLSGSSIEAGIGSNLGSIGSQAGDITLNGTEMIVIDGNASILNNVNFGAVGSAGHILIETERLRLSSDAGVQTVTLGRGNTGNLIVRASDSVDVRGDGRIPPTTGLLISVGSSGIGAGGDLIIETQQLEVSNVALIGNETAGIGNSGDLMIGTRRLNVSGGSQIYTSTAGLGNAGDLTIYASDSVELTGEGPIAPGGIFAQTNITPEGVTGTGNGGRLLIETNHLRVSNGSRVQVSTFGRGDAGELIIRANDIEVFNTSEERRFSTGVFAEVANPANTGIRGGAGLRAEGNGGNLTIEAERLSIRNGGEVSSSTRSDGDAGRLRVHASDSIELVGIDSRSNSPSFLGANVFRVARGQGGNVSLRTDRLSVRDGGQVSVRTLGEGNAGILRVRANEIIEVTGRTPDRRPSELSAAVEASSTGRGGSLILSTHRLQLTDGARISANTSGQRGAGNIRVRDAETVILSNRSGISTAINQGAAGQGGSINLETGTLRLNGLARISSSTAGQGDTGRIRVQATEGVFLTSRSRITSNVDEGAIGNSQAIILQTPQLSLAGNSRISADTLAEGNAGDISIQEAEAISLSNSSISTSVGVGVFEGRGGNIDIETDSLQLDNRSRINAQSQGQDNAGNIIIAADEQLSANNSDITTSAQNSSGGTINIESESIRLRGDSDIRTEVENDVGNGGDITLSANSIVAFNDSDILAFAGEQGGDINFDTPAALFEGGYQPATETASDPSPLDNNNQVDANARGAVAGVITLPDVSFIENSLNALSENAVNPDTLLANSCIARIEQGGTFLITGSGGLPNRPGNARPSPYPAGTVRSAPDEADPPNKQTWQPGDPVVEPQGVYRLSDGRLVMSRECSR